MKRHNCLQVHLGLIGTNNFEKPVNFKVECFINEETEGALTDSCYIIL